MYYLETQNVVKQYSGHRALDGVSIRVPENKIFGLLGPNGAGKTTLIRIINQITAPDSGIVLLNNEPLKEADIQKIGYLPEERGLYKKMKVMEEIVYLGQLKGLSKAQAKDKAQWWLDKFNISDWKDKKVEELSKGMQQKIQFITTILHEPKLIILDEPFSGFDPVNAELLKKEILELRDAGATIIFSTHNMSSVEELCENITLINHSKAVLEGNVTKIRQQFKKHIFSVQVSGENFSSKEGIYSLVSAERQPDNTTKATIRIEGSLSNSEVIVNLAKDYNIVAFEEILPSMQEVFIETVQGSPVNEETK